MIGPGSDKNVRKCRLQRNTGKTFRQNPKCRLRRNKSTTFWHKSDDCILAAAPSNSLLLCLANFDLNMEIFWGLTSYNLFTKSYFLWIFFFHMLNKQILEFFSRDERKGLSVSTMNRQWLWNQYSKNTYIGILIQKPKEKAFLWTQWIGNGCDPNQVESCPTLRHRLAFDSFCSENNTNFADYFLRQSANKKVKKRAKAET